LARGARLVELLKQPAASPFPIGQEIVSIWAGTTGKLDDVDVSDVRRFERELLEYVGHNDAELFESLATAGKLEDEAVARLEKLVTEFKNQFSPSSDTAGGTSSSSAAASTDSATADDSSASSESAAAGATAASS
jgi:F-type H+-transporting ATPase subunit alpha